MIDVKAFREERGISQPAAVAVIKEKYPGFDKALISKVENPDRYGIRLLNHAEQALEEAFPKTAPEPHRTDKRRKVYKVTWRGTQSLGEVLQRRFRADGFETIQAGFDYLVGLYLSQKEDTNEDS